MPELHASDERLVDLALTDLDSRDQDALSAHLALCEACRLRYARIADTVDGVLVAAPSIAPPPGFTSGVLKAIGLDPSRVPDAGPVDIRPAPTRSSRRWLLIAAVAAVLALLAGVAGTALVLSQTNPPASSLAGTPIVTADGETVGSIQAARYEGNRVVVISVSGRPGATYDCRVELADGTQETLASWTLPPDGSAAWVVEVPEGQPTVMDLVAPSGRVWASAQL